jgi:hypothetical protein
LSVPARAQKALTFRVAVRPASDANSREHWSVRAKRHAKERNAIHWASIAALGPDWPKRVEFPVRVTFTRTSQRLLDDDNLVSSGKSSRDEIAKMLGITDGPKDPRATWAYAQRQGDPGLEVLIETIGPAPICSHRWIERFRHPFGDLGEFHIVERCSSCHTRTREAWVPHEEVPNAETLPVDPWMNGNDPRQVKLL